jgi:tryptophanyl-tRNA synthetase
MKRRILSGMQATGGGRLHLGNLEGALRPWIRLQETGEYEMFCFVADWHVMTTIGDQPIDIEQASRNVAIDYLAAGLDPSRTAIFKQSDVKEHAELHLLLSMLTPVGWLERIPSYKEKREMVKENQIQVSYGLMGYPVLQTADILIYRADAVPVGKDQAAHLEISREIARRFNRIADEEIFPIPEALIGEVTGEIKGLDGRKMSKSYGNAIFLGDTDKQTQKALNSAYTTPTKIHVSDPGVPEGCAVCNLRRVYDPEGYQTQWDECRTGLRGCGQSKKETTEIINASLSLLRARRNELLDNPTYVDQILSEGADKAREAASATMSIVRRALKISQT